MELEKKAREIFEIPSEYRLSMQSTTEILMFDHGSNTIYVNLQTNSAIHSWLSKVNGPNLPCLRCDEFWPR